MRQDTIEPSADDHVLGFVLIGLLGTVLITSVAGGAAADTATKGPVTVAVSEPGPLFVNPQNPRYFTDGTGRSILLVGSHTWANFVDNGLSDPPRAFDYASYLDFLEANNLNFFRLWTWEQAKWNTWTSTPYWFAPSPYQRTGPGTALDGKPKFDLTSFNQAYFDRMRQHVIDAGAKGIYASIMLFQGWGVGDRTEYSGNPWSGHPFNAANNASGVNGDLDGDGRGGEVHTLASAPISALQDAYVRKVIDTVNDLDNVLYEICNECNPESIDWQNHMIALIKSYEAGKPKRHPVGFTGDYWYSNATLFSSNADWISPGGGPNGSAYLDTPPPASGAKVIISDTDHLWGMGGDRTWVWKSITRGINTMIMDGFGSEDYIAVAHPGWTTNDPNWVSMRANMGYARSYAQRMNLTAMPPRGDLTSTTYALASPTAATPEFLVYAPSGGTFTVNLTGTAGSFSVEWLRPATGAKTSGANVAGGATRSFTPPFAGDAVLYLRSDAETPAAPTSLRVTP